MKNQKFQWVFAFTLLAALIIINPVLSAQEKANSVKMQKIGNFLIVEDSDYGPISFYLAQNQPNPFSAATTVQFAVPQKSEFTLTIYNSDWQPVRSIYKGIMERGFYKFEWDGKNDQNQAVAHGTYYCRLQSGDFDTISQMYFLD